jgi:hypothetical protein
MHKQGKSLLMVVSLALVACLATITTAQAQQRAYGFGTATSTAAAATINQNAGVITTEALTTAAAATYSLTLTNSTIETTNAVVLAEIVGGTNTRHGLIVDVVPAAGSAVINVYNGNASAINGTLKIAFVVISR